MNADRRRISTRAANACGFSILSMSSPTCFHAADGSFIDRFLVGESIDFHVHPTSTLPSFSNHIDIVSAMDCDVAPPVLAVGFQLRQLKDAVVASMNNYIEDRVAELGMPTDSNLENGGLELVAESISMIFRGTIERYVPISDKSGRNTPLSSIDQAAAHHADDSTQTTPESRSRHNHHCDPRTGLTSSWHGSQFNWT